jgi:hypothetical protein
MLLSKAGINSTYNGAFGGASGMKSPPFLTTLPGLAVPTLR